MTKIAIDQNENLNLEKNEINRNHADFNEELSESNNKKQLNKRKQEEQRKLLKLWRSVISQAMSDLKTKSHKWQAEKNRKMAKKWLLGYSEDFFQVCALAEINPCSVINKAWNILKNNEK